MTKRKEIKFREESEQVRIIDNLAKTAEELKYLEPRNCRLFRRVLTEKANIREAFFLLYDRFEELCGTTSNFSPEQFRILCAKALEIAEPFE